MFKNTAGKLTVLAFADAGHATLDAGEPVTAGAGNITCKVEQDDDGTRTAVADTNPTETEDGQYVFDLTAAEANGNKLTFYPESSTAGVQVVALPSNVIYTRPVNFPDLGIEPDGDLTKVNTLDGHTPQSQNHTSAIGAIPTNPALAGDAMALTGSERTTLAAAIEAAIINEVDGNAVMQAIADLIADDMTTGDLTVAAIAAAARDAILDRVLVGNHDTPGTVGGVLGADFNLLEANISDIGDNIDGLDLLLTGVKGVTDNIPNGGAMTDLALILTAVQGTLSANVVQIAGSNVTSQIAAGFSFWFDVATPAKTMNDAGVAGAALTAQQVRAEMDDNSTQLAKLDGMRGASFDTETDSLEAIRNRGDSNWTGGGGGSANAGANVLIADLDGTQERLPEFKSVIQGESQLIRVDCRARTGFSTASPTSIAVVVSDTAGTRVTIDDADVTRILEDIKQQVIEFTLSTTDTTSFAKGPLNVEVAFDSQKTRIPQAIHVIEAL